MIQSPYQIRKEIKLMAKCASCGRQLGTFRDPYAKLKEMNKHKRKGEMWECDY